MPTEELLKGLLELQTRTFASKAAAKAELVKVLERNLGGGKLTAKELKELDQAAGQLLKGRIAPKNGLLNELAQQGVKHTPENVVAIAKDASGKIVFLEKGGPKAGLQHIVEQHGSQFAQQGIAEAQIHGQRVSIFIQA